jgi:hypothetical protein
MVVEKAGGTVIKLAHDFYALVDLHEKCLRWIPRYIATTLVL